MTKNSCLFLIIRHICYKKELLLIAWMFELYDPKHPSKNYHSKYIRNECFFLLVLFCGTFGGWYQFFFLVEVHLVFISQNRSSHKINVFLWLFIWTTQTSKVETGAVAGNSVRKLNHPNTSSWLSSIHCVPQNTPVSWMFSFTPFLLLLNFPFLCSVFVQSLSFSLDG